MTLNSNDLLDICRSRSLATRRRLPVVVLQQNGWSGDLARRSFSWSSTAFTKATLATLPTRWWALFCGMDCPRQGLCSSTDNSRTPFQSTAVQHQGNVKRMRGQCHNATICPCSIMWYVMTTLYQIKQSYVWFFIFLYPIVKPACVKGRMRKQGATPTRLDVLGVSTTMAASLPEVKFQGNSDCKSNPRYVCSYMYKLCPHVW